MTDTFDYEIVIHAPIEDVFSVLSDPDELAHATKKSPFKEVSAKPANVGTTWWYPAPLRSKVHVQVTHYTPPRRTARRLTGAIAATADYRLNAESPETTTVSASYHVEHLPWFATASQFFAVQKQGLEEARKYLEQSRRYASTAELEIVSTCSVEDSDVRPGRKQATITLQTVAKVHPHVCYEVVVRDVDRFWEWMVDRSSPDAILNTTDDWPAAGSCYTYKAPSKLPWLSWEHGKVSVIESSPPNHVLLREEQDVPLLRNVFLTDWSFDEAPEGTRIVSRYRITGQSLLARFWLRKPDPLMTSLRKQLENVVSVASERANLPGGISCRSL